MMDAYGMVTKAKSWKTVDKQIKCNISIISTDSTPRYLLMTQSISILADVSLE